MININALTFTYPHSDFYLEIPALSINAAEKVAIIGPSGAGKTSFLKLIAGILLPQQGKVCVNQTIVNELSDAERRNFRIRQIGIIFQDFELLDYLDTRDNILHPFRISRALRLNSDIRARADVLANELGIASKMKHLSNELSQGEKQRVAICRAMLPQPKLILADEATGNLDPANKIKIIDSLFQSIAKTKATLIAVTHDHELLDRFDRIIDFSHYYQTV